MISLVLAAALHASPVVITQKSTDAKPAPYVRMKMKVNGYGIPGSATLLVDRTSGRYIEHFDLGPQSFYQGFDGTRAWQADVNGTLAVQGNAFDSGTIRSWGYLFAFPRQARTTGASVQYPDVTQAVTFAFNRTSRRVERAELFNGLTNQAARFSAYRDFANGINVPSTIAFTDDNGTWTAQVLSVEPVSHTSAADFAPPARANDSSLSGDSTSVPFLTATEIILPVRINDGPVMHFILDTGGQNVLLASAVKQLHLQTIGHGSIGGAGAGFIPTSFAMVRSVRIGNAEMRNQPFIILNSPVLHGFDGIVGFELLSRFAARVDYGTNTLTLSNAVSPSWTNGVPATPFSFRSRQPAVNGAIDGFPALLSIDTGNSGVLDVNTPFADRHNLWDYYHAAKPKRGSLAGVGGGVNSSNVTIRHLQLGAVTLDNVYAELTQATSGIEAHPAVSANAGEGIFRNFNFILDYAHQRLYFAPGGLRDMSGLVLGADAGRIVVQHIRTHFAERAGVRVGMTLSSINGKTVSASDLDAVRETLHGEPGSTVDLLFDGGTRVKLPLINYL